MRRGKLKLDAVREAEVGCGAGSWGWMRCGKLKLEVFPLRCILFRFVLCFLCRVSLFCFVCFAVVLFCFLWLCFVCIVCFYNHSILFNDISMFCFLYHSSWLLSMFCYVHVLFVSFEGIANCGPERNKEYSTKCKHSRLTTCICLAFMYGFKIWVGNE